MQLRKIELLGFKSFAQRTDFTFDSGITAVVGPNGCGKSNVVDAVRWVLGEQSAKSLRASAMGDCIFAGTSTAKPMGMAQVTLTFDNASGKLSVPYQEVEITRRVYGSGEGEYFINRQPCRLRDIRELFMGTGVGTTAYSVIEQGEITRIISSDPKELRAVFDEAAGIGLYKARLRAATAKLDRVTQNLLRVNDVLAEVEKNLRSVKYQAAKANRYRELSARLKDLKLNRARRAYTDLGEKLASLRAALADKKHETAGIERALAELETAGEEANRALAQIEDRIRALGARVAGLETREAELRHAMDICRERMARHEENEARLSKDIESRRADLEAFEKRAVELERRTLRAQGRTGRLSKAALAAGGVEHAAGEAERSLGADIATAENESVEMLRAAVKLNNRFSEIAAGERAAAQQKQRLAERLGGLESQSASVRDELAGMIARKAELLRAAGNLEGRIDSVRLARTATESTHAHLEKDLKTADERLAALSSRRQLLEDLHRRRDGISDAARAVLEMELPGTLGLVAELLSVPRDLAVCVESALGENAAAVVVQTTQTALDAVKSLRQSQAGRAKIISLERAASHALPAREVAAAGLTRIAGRVAAAAECGPLVETLMANAYLAEDLESALAANGATAGLTIVTPSGDRIDPNGGITGGAAQAAGGLIWRKAEIQSLTELEAQVRSESAELEDRKLQIQGRLAALDERTAELETSLREVTTAVVQTDGRITAAEGSLAGIARERAVTEAELAAVEEEIAKAVVEREAVRVRMDQTRRQQAEQEARLAALKDKRAEALARREHARGRVTRLKVKLASSLEKQASLERQFADGRAALEEKAAQLETATAQIAAARNAASDETVALARAAEELERTHAGANATRVVLAAETRKSTQLGEEAARIAPALKETRITVDAARQVVSDLSIQEREAAVRLDDVINRAREEFGADPGELAAESQGIADPAAADDEIAELSKKLASMGGVNMEALAELDSLQGRHDFLAAQHDDLAGAKESLEDIITRTRATSRKMFLESFESVREHFSTMFRRLFGGGRAECILLDPENVLESPIQIIAKPPGKEPSNLNLLSGGEKAMTAVALLFAMFATRPSPFLILDEVDAPLDESNIGRFIDLMNDYLPQCQFVVITHNRRTMAAADTLYGITMEQEGVSKKVSVSFKSQAPTPEPVTV